MSLAPGTMVTQNVRLLEQIGQGGMGSVWLADHLGLETRVAVKFITPELVAQVPSLKRRFHREASITARLRSIHAVQTFDHGLMDDGTPYIVMEHLEGKDLAETIEEDGALTVREVGMLVAQVAKVLQRAHKLGIVHRDIKPDNVFLTADSDYELFVKVLDFGIAKEADKPATSNVTKTGAVVGTPEFMSPEQAISAKELDYRSDLFSLGVVAFYALTGELPFDETSETPLWLQMSQGDHRSVRSVLPHLSPAVEAWFEQALQPKPDHRFGSAREMAKALAKAITDGGYEDVDDLSSTSMNLPAARVRLDSIDESDSWPDFSNVPDGPPTIRRGTPPEGMEDDVPLVQPLPAPPPPMASQPPLPAPRPPMASKPLPPPRPPMRSRAPLPSAPPLSQPPAPRAESQSILDESTASALALAQWPDTSPPSKRTVGKQAAAAAVFLVVLLAVTFVLVRLGMG